MNYKAHYSEALDYLRDYCLRHGRPTRFTAGQTAEAEGAAASLLGYVEAGSFHYMVRDSHGTGQVVETASAGDIVANYPYCLDGDPAPTAIVAAQPAVVRLVSGQQLNRHFCQSKEAARMALQFLKIRFAQLHQLRRQYYFTHQPEDDHE